MRLPFGLTPDRDKPESPYGDMYPRAVAASIDIVLILTLLWGLLQYIQQRLCGPIIDATYDRMQQAQTASEMVSIFFSLLINPYYVANSVVQIVIIGALLITTQAVWGTTPGKWLIGLKIVRADTFEPISTWRYALRFLAYIPSILPLMLGIFWISFNKERRGWHDYIAGTVVLNQRQRGWYWKQFKKGISRLRGKSGAVEQAVGEPSAEQRHQDRG